MRCLFMKHYYFRGTLKQFVSYTSVKPIHSSFTCFLACTSFVSIRFLMFCGLYKYPEEFDICKVGFAFK
jgi:hypothetical protein